MNTKKFYFLLSKTLLGAVLITGTVTAAETNDKDESQHIAVGERAASHSERVKLHENRIRLSQKFQSDENLTNEDVEISEEEMANFNADQQEENESERQEQLVKSAKGQAKGFSIAGYYSSHEGAFHRPLVVSLFGDTVELEDGSIWSVCSSDRYKTLDWLTGDVIVITPNNSWFSAYDYTLINLNTGAVVKVNLSLGPIYNGIYTHWIVGIDYLHNEIFLEDGSIWKMSCVDHTTVTKWLLNDTVIIGINDGWWSGSNPNMLINVNTNDYAVGKCLY